MRYRILATDYDGTLALHGATGEDVVEALRAFRASGRSLILVTGRELDELKAIFPEHTLFDRIVAENGALVYNPATMKERLLGEAPPAVFINELANKGVQPLSVGRVIVATWEPHEVTVLEAIKEAGLEHQVIFNKGAVMILPPGVNKARGLEAALDELCVSMHNVVAVGDAENDGAMLHVAECAVSVANALPALQQLSDWVTDEKNGAGVMQLINRILDDDLLSLEARLYRHYLRLGERDDGKPFTISPYGGSMLLAGTSGSGKTTLTAAFMEALMEKGYQFCMVDPEGDYMEMEGVVTIGDIKQPPAIEPLLQLLEKPGQSVVACTLALTMDEKPFFMRQLLGAFLQLQQRRGHPHWLLLDEAHHLMPAGTNPEFFNIPAPLNNFMAITTKPALLYAPLLEQSAIVITMGDKPEQMLQSYAGIVRSAVPEIKREHLKKGEALVWDRRAGETPFLVKHISPLQVLQRHKRKYAVGDMGPTGFVFTGKEGKLRLQAPNLHRFTELMQGIDDGTWLYHLERKDYSKWIRYAVSDEALADLVEEVENGDHDPQASRQAIARLIQQHYTGPA